MHAGPETTIRTGPGTLDWFKIRKGVCQGCTLSPSLFNFYAAYNAKHQAGWITSWNQGC